VHGARGGKKALPKKEDVVFHVMQMGWQGACVLAHPQGPWAGRSEPFLAYARLDQRLPLIVRQPTKAKVATNQTLFWQLPSVGVIKRYLSF